VTSIIIIIIIIIIRIIIANLVYNHHEDCRDLQNADPWILWADIGYDAAVAAVVSDKASYLTLPVDVGLYNCVRPWCTLLCSSHIFFIYSSARIITAQCTLVHLRGLAIACRLSVFPSVRLSVCNVGDL